MIALKDLIASASKILGGQWLTLGLTTIEGILLARTLGPTQYGNWSMVQALFATTSAILGFRVADALIRHAIAAIRDEKKSALGQLIAAALTIDSYVALGSMTIGYCLACNILPGLTNEAEYKSIAVIYTFSLLQLTTLNTWTALKRISGQIWQLSLVPAIMVFFRVATLLLLWITNESMSPYWVATSYSAAAIITTTIQALDIRKYLIQHRIKSQAIILRPWRQPELFDFFNFIKAGFAASTLGSLIKNADVLILGYFSNPQAVAYYRLAKSIVGALQTAATAVSQILFVNLSALHRNQYQESIKSLFRITFLRLFAPITSTFIVAAITMPYIIPEIYGEDYIPTSNLIHIMLVGTWFAMVLFWVNPMILAMDRLKEYVTTLAATTIITLAAQLALIPTHDALGAAIAFSIAWGGGHIISLAFLYKIYQQLQAIK